MTIAQIAAIISLLMAFGVDQPTVNNVQAILENSNSPAQSIGIPVELEVMPTTTEDRLTFLRGEADRLALEIYALTSERTAKIKASTKNEVYAIRAEYDPKIEALQEQLRKVQKEANGLYNDAKQAQ